MGFGHLQWLNMLNNQPLQKLLDASALDPSLREKLKTVPDVSAVVQIANTARFGITVEEIKGRPEAPQ